MFRLPFAGAHRVAGGRDVPAAQEINFCFAFGDDNEIIGADRFDEFGQPIGYDANAIDVVDPFACPAGIRPLLPSSS